jgi:glycosyltransferase involved in cell wall biosynthesis
MRRDWPNPAAVLRLAKMFRGTQTDLIQTWMYHADLVGGIAARLSGVRAPVVWNIRHSTFDPAQTRRRTVHVARLGAVASHWLPHTIICCSIAAQRVHSSLGYSDARIRVIPNGFDLSRFRADAVARREIRDELGLPSAAPVVGRFGRFDPQKDYRTFVDAAALLHRRRPEVHFLLCGLNVDTNNSALGGWIDAAGLRSVCRLTGYRHDVNRVIAAIDLAASSSAYGEAFPNVLAEAMACEVPCVATDVGDSAYIVGDTGCIVPPRDPAALADAWDALLAKGPDHLRALGRAARRRVEEKFDIGEVVRAYEDTYAQILRGRDVGTLALPSAN